MRIKLKKKALDKAYKIVAKAEQTFTLNCAPHLTERIPESDILLEKAPTSSDF